MDSEQDVRFCLRLAEGFLQEAEEDLTLLADAAETPSEWTLQRGASAEMYGTCEEEYAR
jgi:hypothetical protein